MFVMTPRLVALLACAGLLAGAPRFATADPTQDEVDRLEKRVEQQDQVIRDLESRLDEIEGVPATPPVGAPAEEEGTGEAPAPAERMEAKVYPKSQQSPVKNRGTLEDRQEAAA